MEAQEVEVEVNARGADKPIVIIVGLPDAAVRESSQRVISAIGASALFLDDGVKTVNLAPADLKKEGPSFDLPIALAMVATSRTKPFDCDDCCVVGELGLDGAVRSVKGVLSIALEAKQRGVIIDVDPGYRGTEEWYEKVALSRPPKDRPWYHVLMDGTDNQTYVAERNLEADESDDPIHHPDLDQYFYGQAEGVYVPRRQGN